MQKLALKLDDLNVQSFQTTSGARDGRGTVLGNQEATNDELACSGACASNVCSCATCATCDTCDDACAGGEGPDFNRRIIVYQSPS
jgi:hypothetical protein